MKALKKINQHLNLHFIFTYLMISSLTPLAFSHFEVLNTSETLEPGKMQGIVAPQILTNNASGLNLTGMWDMGYSENSEIRMSLGLGSTDFSFGGSYKLSIFEEQEKRPGLALMVGTYYSNSDGSNEFSLRAAPIASKNFNSNSGYFSPYISMPFAFTAKSGDHFLPIHLTLGTRWKRRPDVTDWYLMTELAFNLNDTFSYISVAAVFSLDKFSIVSKDRTEQKQKERDQNPLF